MSTDNTDPEPTPDREQSDGPDADMPEGAQPQAPELIDMQAVIHDQLERDEEAEKGSHRELDPSVFHASSIGYPIRQAYLSKLGLKEIDADTLGTFKTGTLIHEYIEQALQEGEHDVLTEHPVEVDAGKVTFVGHCDAYDHSTGVVYDFKTRASWYKFDPPTQRHIDQLLIYMYALNAPYGQVVYVSKSDMEVRTWPEDEPFRFADHRERFQELVEKAHTIREAIRENGIPTKASDIPFEKGDDWISQQEELVGWMQ